jgi:hypothetical protein
LGWNWQQCVVSFFLSPADPYHSIYCIWKTSLVLPKVTLHHFLSAPTALIFLRDIEDCLDVSFFFLLLCELFFSNSHLLTYKRPVNFLTHQRIPPSLWRQFWRWSKDVNLCQIVWSQSDQC